MARRTTPAAACARAVTATPRSTSRIRPRPSRRDIYLTRPECVLRAFPAGTVYRGLAGDHLALRFGICPDMRNDELVHGLGVNQATDAEAGTRRIVAMTVRFLRPWGMSSPISRYGEPTPMKPPIKSRRCVTLANIQSEKVEAPQCRNGNGGPVDFPTGSEDSCRHLRVEGHHRRLRNGRGTPKPPRACTLRSMRWH